MIDELLRLIETANPKNIEELDEIDALVWCWLHNERYISHTGHSRITFEPRSIPCTATIYGFARPKYTRSRDALKAIRPDGWSFEIKGKAGDTVQMPHCTVTSPGQWFARLRSQELLDYTFNKIECVGAANTEELAELHATLQAIARERAQDLQSEK